MWRRHQHESAEPSMRIISFLNGQRAEDTLEHGGILVGVGPKKAAGSAVWRHKNVLRLGMAFQNISFDSKSVIVNTD